MCACQIGTTSCGLPPRFYTYIQAHRRVSPVEICVRRLIHKWLGQSCSLHKGSQIHPVIGRFACALRLPGSFAYVKALPRNRQQSPFLSNDFSLPLDLSTITPDLCMFNRLTLTRDIIQPVRYRFPCSRNALLNDQPCRRWRRYWGVTLDWKMKANCSLEGNLDPFSIRWYLYNSNADWTNKLELGTRLKLAN